MGSLIRKENWPSILADEIEKAKNKTFKYGTHDCAIWATTVVKKYTNLEWKAPWTNKKEALKFHKEIPMEDRVSKILGKPIGNILLTQRGDLVQKNIGLNSALGLCIGSKVAFILPVGLCYVDLTDCIYSWRI